MPRPRDEPFFDIEGEPYSFTIPHRKWRELLFVGALRREGRYWVRDPDRPLPPFRNPDLFPVGERFDARLEGERVRIRRVRPEAPG